MGHFLIYLPSRTGKYPPKDNKANEGAVRQHQYHIAYLRNNLKVNHDKRVQYLLQI